MIPAAFLSLAATATLTTPQILDRVLVRGVGHVGEFGAFCPAEEKEAEEVRVGGEEGVGEAGVGHRGRVSRAR